ncbi:MAG: hypothetical protein WBD45_09075 [Terriglobales bacterium]
MKRLDAKDSDNPAKDVRLLQVNVAELRGPVLDVLYRFADVRNFQFGR